MRTWSNPVTLRLALNAASILTFASALTTAFRRAEIGFLLVGIVVIGAMYWWLKEKHPTD